MPDRFLQAAPLVSLIEAERPTLAGAVPTIWSDVLRHVRENGGDLSSLRLVPCGGSRSRTRCRRPSRRNSASGSCTPGG